MSRPFRVFVGLCAALGLLLAASLGRRVFPLRGAGRLDRYRELDAWIEAHALPEDRVLVPESGARVFNARATIPLPAGADAAALMDLLQAERPAYCLALDSIAWDSVRAHAWFRDRYHPVLTHDHAADGSAPLTLFLYRPTRFDRGPRVPQALAFEDGAGTRIELDAVRISAARIVPGEPIAVTLFWSPPRPDALPARVVLQLHARDGGRSWARTQGGVPHPSYTLTPPESAPEGAYTLDLALYQPNGRPLRPVTPESDSRAGSEFHTLADLTHPPDVSREAPDPDVPIRAALGDAIELVGYDIPDWVSPGETFRVALYWRAVQPPPDDYTVFVHVLDDEMQMLAQGDGKPVYGFHPTEAWQAGEVIRDVHVMTLDPGIVRQNARVQVGMYAADSGERLPVTLASGEAAPQRALRLHTLRVR